MKGEGFDSENGTVFGIKFYFFKCLITFIKE